MAHLTGEQILAIVSWILTVIVITPIEIHWFRKFWKHRKRLIVWYVISICPLRHQHKGTSIYNVYAPTFYRIRKPQLIRNALIACWVWTLTQWTNLIFIAFEYELPILRYNIPYLQVIVIASNVIHYGITVSRWWILFYS